MTYEIVVPARNDGLELSRGTAVAICLPQKGEKKTYFLYSSGRSGFIEGARIQGVGVKRFFAEQGFESAAEQDPRAIKLADLMDVRRGLALVEEASRNRAQALQRELAGQRCLYVPFDETQERVEVTVSAPDYCTTTVIDLHAGFNSGAVKVQPEPENGYRTSVTLSSGWLRPISAESTRTPVSTEYGGIVEKAVYFIANSGLGLLHASCHLELDLGADKTSIFPRGLIPIDLPCGDVLEVGIDGVDELLVRYVRAGQVIHERSGLYGVRMGDAIGAIAAALVRVMDLDAAPKPKARKKAA